MSRNNKKSQNIQKKTPTNTNKTLKSKKNNDLNKTKYKKSRKKDLYGLTIPISKVKKTLQNNINGVQNNYLNDIKQLINEKLEKGVSREVIINTNYSDLSQELKMYHADIFDDVTGNFKKKKDEPKEPFSRNLDQVKRIISKSRVRIGGNSPILITTIVDYLMKEWLSCAFKTCLENNKKNVSTEYLSDYGSTIDINSLGCKMCKLYKTSNVYATIHNRSEDEQTKYKNLSSSPSLKVWQNKYGFLKFSAMELIKKIKLSFLNKHTLTSSNNCKIVASLFLGELLDRISEMVNQTIKITGYKTITNNVAKNVLVNFLVALNLYDRKIIEIVNHNLNLSEKYSSRNQIKKLKNKIIFNNIETNKIKIPKKVFETPPIPKQNPQKVQKQEEQKKDDQKQEEQKETMIDIN